MKWFRLNRNSIQTKLTVALMAIVTLALTGFGTFDYFATKARLTKELNAAGNAASQRLAESMSLAIWEMHLETGLAAAEAEMTDQRIAAIVVIEKNSEKSFLAVKRKPDSAEIEAFDGNFKSDFAPISRDAARQGESLGTVTLFMSHDQLQNELRQSVLKLFVQIVILDLILIIGMSAVAQKVVTGPLRSMIAGLTAASDQVASASGQVASSSQTLAEGSSEQAASIEETSSFLEQMASMTRQNSDNATQADSLMKESSQVVGRANASMKNLASAMEEISTANQETQKIVKTIDEISFQTNLLALNAAVEAARAGEAGAGFAVVADEVRNLAMRAAEAAKSTAAIIEGTVNRTQEGKKLTGDTHEAFAEVHGSAEKVGVLVAEIASASKEQAQGIDKINTAVNEMDEIVQSNAASAEESASASQEMTAQAMEMKRFVAELEKMVGHDNSKQAPRKTKRPF